MKKSHIVLCFIFAAIAVSIVKIFFWAASCPPATVNNPSGLSPKHPQQLELIEFESQASCSLDFTENPSITEINRLIQGNPSLPSVEERLPEEALVVMPYEEIGSYGGVLHGISLNIEAGSADILSVRHVNLVRYEDSLKKIVPNVAKSWHWNPSFTKLTFTLRKGHRWSDGKPFTAEDIAFWYNYLVLDPNITIKPDPRFLVEGIPWKVEAINETELRITLPKAKSGLLSQFAVDFAQPFQPKHFLGRYHPKLNQDADSLARSLGFKNGYEVINFYYGRSDWKDVPSPILKAREKVSDLPHAVVPTLESHILIEETSEGRILVANPYFHMVDTQGNQLPYISQIVERYVPDKKERLAKLVRGEVSYKQQTVHPNEATQLIKNQQVGNYTVDMVPTVGENVVISFNYTVNNLAKRKIFNQLQFRQAMSVAIDRKRIIDKVYKGKGVPEQYTIWDPRTVDFVSKTMLSHLTPHNPVHAKKLLAQLGLRDRNQDGFVELPNSRGKPFTLRIRYALQGTPAGIPKIIADNWRAVGVNTVIQEVSSDEYRVAQSANELEVHIWTKIRPAVIMTHDPMMVTPPFDDYFTHRNGMLWAQWLRTGGRQGVKPPAAIKTGMALMKKLQAQVTGSEEQAKIAQDIIRLYLDNLWFIGTVGGHLSPVYHHNSLGNFKTMTVKTYNYYHMYPYRPVQYYIKK